jgi:metal-dependent amidase/aminoacylase/carboxypeptidase family protein
MSDWRRSIDGYVDDQASELIAIRRHIHAHPEPSGDEIETTRYLADKLREAGISYRIPPSGRGIIAESEASAAESRVAMRGDIDALRMHDEKSAPYRSTRPGVMHACGHDAHAAMLLGAAAGLQRCRSRLPWDTAWRAIFQPAEETHRGAIEMIDAGALQGVQSIVSLHVDPMVVSFGVIEGGANPNVIPELVRLRGTIRTLTQNSSACVKERILAIGHGLGEASQARIDIAFHRGPDSVVNDPRVTEVCTQAATRSSARIRSMPSGYPAWGAKTSPPIWLPCPAACSVWASRVPRGPPISCIHRASTSRSGPSRSGPRFSPALW